MFPGSAQNFLFRQRENDITCSHVQYQSTQCSLLVSTATEVNTVTPKWARSSTNDDADISYHVKYCLVVVDKLFGCRFTDVKFFFNFT